MAVIDVLFGLATIQNFVSLTVLCIAVNTDVKRQLIPDQLTHPAVMLGLANALMSSLQYMSHVPFVLSLGGFAAGLMIGWLFCRVGFWYAGDAKLLAALGSIMWLNVFYFKFILYLLMASGIVILSYFLRRKRFTEVPLAIAFLMAYVCILVTSAFSLPF